MRHTSTPITFLVQQQSKYSVLHPKICSTTELVASCRCYSGNRIAVRFEYEYHDDTGKWFRAHGNEVCPPSPQPIGFISPAVINKPHSN